MATILTAIAGVFVILAGWITVDLLARRQLGERHHGCHGSADHHRHDGLGCAGCHALQNCPQAEEAQNPPKTAE